MSSFSHYVCWEWRRDDGGFSPYTPNESSALESAYSAGKPQHTTTGPGGGVVCFTSMTQSGRGNPRRVRRDVFSLPTTTQDVTAYWEWSDSPGHSIPYQMEASVDIELVFQQGMSTVDLAHQPSRLPYTVDFQHMCQTRHRYNTRRPILRVPLPTGTTLQGLLKEKPIAGSGFGQALGMNPAGHMAPPPHSYAGGNSLGLLSTATTYQSGYAAAPPPLGATSIALGTSHLGHAPSAGISHIGHTPAPPTYHTPTSHYAGHTPSPYGHAPSSISGHTHINITPMVSSHAVSSMLTPLSSSATTGISSARPGIYSPHNVPSPDPPSASTRSKSGSRAKTTASKAPKSSQGQGKAVAKPKGKAKAKKRAVGRASMGGASSDTVGGASSNPVGGACGADALLVYAKKLDRLKPKHDEPCPICMNKLSETSGFEDDDPSPTTTPPNSPHVYKLRKCPHRLHYSCLSMYIKNSAKNGFQCPTCKKPYGMRTGDMPPTGTMQVHTQRGSLPGHEGHGIIQITYSFSPGYNNGKHYRANGFPRTCYLPDSPKGNRVLKLLRVAWDRKLTFTIGTSVTTGAMDTVVWNEIHHKTECGSNHSGHGYPDPYYLERVMLELSAQGVVEGGEKEEEEEAEEESSESSSDGDGDGDGDEAATKSGRRLSSLSSDSL